MMRNPAMAPARRTVAKIFWRIMPIIMLGSAFCNLDRANIAFASIKMNADLGLSAAQFGFAAGIFFLGYVLFCIPGSLAGPRIGFRRYLPAVMVAWGVCSMATALARNAAELSFIRLLLGAAEASFVPCALLLIARWIPESHRGRFTAWFWMAPSIATMVGAPLSGFILTFDDIAGMRSWQMLFVAEAAPVCLIGLVAYWFLPDDPGKARWLDGEERAWLASHVDGKADAAASGAPGLLRELRSPRVMLLSAAYFLIMITGISFSFFYPPYLHSRGIDVVTIGVGVSVVHGLSAVATLLWGRCSDHFARNRHLVFLAAAWTVAAAVGLLPLASGAATMLTLGLAVQIGMNGAVTTFWPLPMSAVRARAAAGVLAAVTMVGNIAGIVGPYVTGLLRDRTDSYGLSFALLASCAAMAGFLILASRRVGVSQERGRLAA